jgi:tight adherence protein B
MQLGDTTVQIALVAFIAVAIGGLVLGLAYPYFSGDASRAKRMSGVTQKGHANAARSGIRARLVEDAKDNRRKQIQDSLKQIEVREKKRKKRLTIRTMIAQAGLEVTARNFHLFSLALGSGLAVASFIAGVPWFVAAVAFVVGGLGVPRWTLNYLRKRRQQVFLNDFADAVDVMVRGLKAGLPINDALKVIANETGAPVGPEFSEVVEGQRVGITIDQGIERMFERIPLAEVNFLSIVLSIQAKTGGNLAEALSNLSKVLRDRKKMKAKIKSVSQEAKASAAIIGSLPFFIMGAMTVLNPEYLNPLFDTSLGHIMLVGSAVWMLTGCLVMRKMINFDF